MEVGSAFSAINWLAIIVATACNFVLGGLWYGPLFGKAWMREQGFSEEDLKGANFALIYGTSFVLGFVASVILAMFLGAESDLVFGLAAGLFIGIGWVATSIGTNYLFERSTMRLFLINSGYHTVRFAVVGMILGAWH